MRFVLLLCHILLFVLLVAATEALAANGLQVQTWNQNEGILVIYNEEEGAGDDEVIEVRGPLQGNTHNTVVFKGQNYNGVQYLHIFMGDGDDSLTLNVGWRANMNMSIEVDMGDGFDYFSSTTDSLDGSNVDDSKVWFSVYSHDLSPWSGGDQYEIEGPIPWDVWDSCGDDVIDVSISDNYGPRTMWLTDSDGDNELYIGGAGDLAEAGPMGIGCIGSETFNGELIVEQDNGGNGPHYIWWDGTNSQPISQ